MANLRETMLRAGEELRRLREEQHITQQEMESRTAQRFGYEARVYAQQVSRIEKAQLDKPPILDLLRVGQVLGLSADDILDLYQLRPGQRAKAARGDALQRLDPRLRAAITLAEELPTDARERFLDWVEFATIQARAELRATAHATSSSGLEAARGKRSTDDEMSNSAPPADPPPATAATTAKRSRSPRRLPAHV